jgi:hypothetical protein
MNVMDWISFVLVVIGGLNWGLFGAFNFNLVSVIFGAIPVLERIIYIVVGLAALYAIFSAAMKK